MLISTHAATAPLYNLIRGNGGNGRHQSFARVLSIAIILISLAPLASLYLLLFSLGLGSTTGDGDATVVALPHHDPVHAPAAQEHHQQQQHPYGAFYALTHNTHTPASYDKPPTTTTHRKRETGHKEDTTGVSATAATLEQMWSQALFVGSTPQLLHAAAAVLSSSSLLSNEDDDHNKKAKKRDAKNASSTTTTTTTSPLLASLLATRTYFPGKVQTIHHLSVVLPWLLTFMLGVCVPAALSLYSFWRQYQNRHLPSAQPTSSKRQRRSQIQKRLAPYSQTLTRHDRIQRQPSSSNPASPQSLPPSRDDPSDASSCSDDDDLLLFAAVKDCANNSVVDKKKQKRSDKDEERLTLRTCGWRYCPSATTSTDPKEAKSLPAAPAPRTIPNTCAICLHSYRVGDVVCGSPNPACIHAFHASCISSWLVTRQQQGRGECPCCRQSYLFVAGGGGTTTTSATT